MKNMILILSMFFLFSGCDKETQTEPQENSIYGTWQLTEIYALSGTTGKWEQVRDGYTFSIEPSNTFSSEKFQECTQGTVEINETRIIFKYECDGFTAGIESPVGEFSYTYSFVENKLSLHPDFLSCIEGCGYRFSKRD